METEQAEYPLLKAITNTGQVLVYCFVIFILVYSIGVPLVRGLGKQHSGEAGRYQIISINTPDASAMRIDTKTGETWLWKWDGWRFVEKAERPEVGFWEGIKSEFAEQKRREHVAP